jgi:hypothetical protein
MRSTIRAFALISLTSATTAFAQGPVPPMGGPQGRGPAGVPAAQMLLARTGELGLTDAQVVRLAAIARRAETRRAGLRAAMDSARQRFAPGQNVDTAARRAFRQRMIADAEKAREAARVDQRDAIAVLNADQQAKAWEMVANRGRMARAGAMRGRGERGMRMGPGRGMDAPRFRDQRDQREPMREPMRDREMRPRRVPFDSGNP